MIVTAVVGILVSVLVWFCIGFIVTEGAFHDSKTSLHGGALGAIIGLVIGSVVILTQQVSVPTKQTIPVAVRPDGKYFKSTNDFSADTLFFLAGDEHSAKSESIDYDDSETTVYYHNSQKPRIELSGEYTHGLFGSPHSGTFSGRIDIYMPK